MWVLFFQDAPRFWLCNNTVCTIGRKGTDITVLDDASLSRSHATLRVGAHSDPKCAAPTAVVIVDGSKYGTTVVPLRTDPGRLPAFDATAEAGPPAQLSVSGQRELALPRDSCAARLHLGVNETVFFLVWEPRPVAIASLPRDQIAAVAESASLCGCHVTDVRDAAFVIVGSLDPTPAVMGAICAGKPLVDQRYLERIRTRQSLKVPPPAFVDTFVMPETIHPSWNAILNPSSSAAQVDITGDLFKPRPERCTLLSGVTLVVFQKVLFTELTAYVSFSRGHVVLDELPPALAGTTTSAHATEALQPFAARHAAHVVVFTALAPVNETHLAALRSAGLVCVDYHEVVRCLLTVNRLTLPESHPAQRVPTLATTHNAVVNSETDVTARAATVIDVNAWRNKRGRDNDKLDRPGDPLGSRSLRVLADAEPSEEFDCPVHESTSKKPHARDLTVAVPAEPLPKTISESCFVRPSLPNLPCFAAHVGNTPVGAQVFKKQALAPSVTAVEMAVVVPTGGFRVTSRVAAVDADDIVPSQVDFDVPVRSRGAGPGLEAIALPARAAPARSKRESKKEAKTEPKPKPRIDVVDPPPAVPTSAVPPPGPVDIFAVDALY